jgi:hypothetical protein
MNKLPNSKQIGLINKLTKGDRLVQYQTISNIVDSIYNQKNEAERKKLLKRVIELIQIVPSHNCCTILADVLVQFYFNNSNSFDMDTLINSFLILINSKNEKYSCLA